MSKELEKFSRYSNKYLGYNRISEDIAIAALKSDAHYRNICLLYTSSFEVIVVDDGSKDQSLPIIEEYANRFKNIKLYTHPGNQNRGLAETVILGIEKSNGEYKMCIRDSFNI